MKYMYAITEKDHAILKMKHYKQSANATSPHVDQTLNSAGQLTLFRPENRQPNNGVIDKRITQVRQIVSSIVVVRMGSTPDKPKWG